MMPTRHLSATPASVRGARMLGVLVAALIPCLSACGMLPAKEHRPEPAAARVLPPPTPRTEGAIYQAGQQMELFADLKARRVGDVLTIRLTESTNASKNAGTKTSKTTAVANTGPTVFGKTITAAGVPIFNTSMNGADSFAGEGSSTQSNSLAGSLTVTVTDVQANGNLVVQGDKSLKLNQGEEFVHIAGVIRPADIATDNTVTSDKIADAHISYSGRGVINSANRTGWLARFFNSPFAPF
jgi:flagellar L-ring protein precursor FlgH